MDKRYIKDSEGNEKQYDSNGNLIYLKNPNGFEQWFQYDESNRLTYFSNSDGYWETYEYINYIINKKDSNGYDEIFQYTRDPNGNRIKIIYYYSDPEKGYRKYFYHKLEQIPRWVLNVVKSLLKDDVYESSNYKEYFDGTKEYTVYTDKGKSVYTKRNNGYEEIVKFNKENDRVYYKDSNGNEETWD